MNSSLLVIVTVLMVIISTVCGKFHFLKFSKIFSTYVRALYCVHLRGLISQSHCWWPKVKTWAIKVSYLVCIIFSSMQIETDVDWVTYETDSIFVIWSLILFYLHRSSVLFLWRSRKWIVRQRPDSSQSHLLCRQRNVQRFAYGTFGLFW